MITPSGPVFLGAVVNPKTKEPVFPEMLGATYHRTIQIMAAVRSDAGGYAYIEIGEGYLEEKNGDADYLKPTEVTGYPRSHTPQGIVNRFKSSGYGTCLYTGLVLLATSSSRGDVLVRNVAGRGEGICSDTDSRSDSADRWWRKALELGLAHTEYGETSEERTETETLEDEDLESYMSSRTRQSIISSIEEAVSNYDGWWPTSISIRGDIERETTVEGSGEEIAADYYRMKDAEKHNLVAVYDPYEGDLMKWSRHVSAEAKVVHKDVILALNVAHQDTRVVAKLAVLAQRAGATEAELAALMIRNRLHADVIQRAPQIPTFIEDVQRVPRRTRLPHLTENGRGTKRVAPRVMYPMMNRNPPAPITTAEGRELDKISAELERRREDLGWASMEALP